MSDMNEAVSEFLIESHENLDRLDNDLLVLEETPDDSEILASIFRTIHTIKGTCGFLGYSSLESVTHVGENLLGKLRDGTIGLTDAITDGLLHMVDAVREMLSQIESTGEDGGGDYADLIGELTRLLESGGSPPPRSAAPVPVPPEPVTEEKPTVAVAEARAASAPPERPEVETPSGGAVPHAQVQADQVITEHKQRGVADSKLRVDVEQLDKLMTLVGELVLARNQILQYQGISDDTGFSATTQRLNLITTELQEGVMKTRMQPIGTIWNKLPRVVRDLAKACGKKMRLEMEGEDTDLDKTILEAIKDPLTHIVRNSVDHGIEPPEVRKASGKPEEGILLLRAFHEGGQVNIEIIDDGGGIRADRVRAKAVERGIITKEQAAGMTEHEVCSLIFAPGFSTAEKVTNVSGRGVGMDVVKTNIEKIGGTVDLQSKEGEGTSLRIRIPLTLAIIPALIVTSGGERFAIPQVNLLELVRLDGDGRGNQIEYIHGTPVYRLRGDLLPLVYLNEQLELQAVETDGDDAQKDNAVNMVVLQAEDKAFGLVVDDINDTEEIVVKPLDKALKDLDVFAGATIMGDGRVALILDVLGITQRSGVLKRGPAEGVGFHDEEEVRVGASGVVQTLLLFSCGGGRRMAIPLSAVARLEEIKIEDIERASDKEVTQYRGEIMPLVRLSDFFGVPRESDRDENQVSEVVVYQHEGRSVGLIVGSIIDIVEAELKVSAKTTSLGILGACVIGGRITDLLDAPGVIASVLPEALAEATFA